jgi:Tol biopolymer transport system component
MSILLRPALGLLIMGVIAGILLGIGLLGPQSEPQSGAPLAPPTLTPRLPSARTPLPPEVIHKQTPSPNPAYFGLTPQPTTTPTLFPGIQLGNETQLSPQGSITEVGSDFDPVWSPDSSKIALLRRFNRPGDPELWVINSDGTSQTRLAASASAPVWSPDSKELAYIYAPPGMTGAELWLVDRLAQAKRKLAMLDQRPPSAPQWIGSKTYYVAEGRIRQVSREGVDLGQINIPVLGGGSAAEMQFQLSPDGTTIALWQSGTLSLGPTATGVVSKIADGVRQDGFQWSPDGRRIAFISYSQGGPVPSLWLANSDGSGATKLLESVNENWQAISWNLVRGVISIMRSPTGIDATYYASRIFLATLDGKAQGYLAPVRYGRMFANWSPDGSRMAYRSQDVSQASASY